MNNKELENKIKWHISHNQMIPGSMILRGDYNIGTDISINESALLAQEEFIIPELKSMVTSEIKREIIKDVLGIDFLNALNEEAKRIIVDALILYDTVMPISEYDVKNKTAQYKDKRMREHLIYEIRNI